MSDEEVVAEEEEARASRTELDDPSPRRIEVKRHGPPQTPAQLAIRIALGTAGLLLVVGFFLPWFSLGELRLGEDLRGTVSGLELVMSSEREVVSTLGVHRWIILLIPALGLALTAIGYLGFRWSGLVAALIGLVIIGYGIVTVVMIFLQTTAFGIWMVLGGTFLATGVGVFAFLRTRSSKEGKLADVSLAADSEAE